MSGEFEFSHGQVVMLENYYSHVGCVPDDSLLEKLTAAVIRMDKANAGLYPYSLSLSFSSLFFFFFSSLSFSSLIPDLGVTQDNVREWFEKREGTPPIESKDKDKDKEKEKENLEQPRDDLPLQEGAPLKQNRDNLRTMLSCHASTSSLPISSSHLHTQRPPRQREGSLQAEPGGYQNSLMQMASTRKEGLDLELEVFVYLFIIIFFFWITISISISIFFIPLDFSPSTSTPKKQTHFIPPSSSPPRNPNPPEMKQKEKHPMDLLEDFLLLLTKFGLVHELFPLVCWCWCWWWCWFFSICFWCLCKVCFCRRYRGMDRSAK